MTDDKTYYPETITDAPLPGHELIGADSTLGKGTKDTYTQSTIPDQTMPSTKIAQELLSNSLNTRSQKIMGVYQFTDTGAIRIGKFVLGESGEILISPDGITAKNKNGDITLAIDADTGDAIYKGILQAQDFTIADENGLISLANFKSQTVNNSVEKSIRAETEADVGMELAFTLKRDTNVLFMTTLADTIALPDNFTGNPGPYFYFYLDGVRIGPSMSNISPEVNGVVISTTITLSGSVLSVVPAGDHVIKLRWKNNDDTGVSYLNYGNVGFSNLTLLALGN